MALILGVFFNMSYTDIVTPRSWCTCIAPGVRRTARTHPTPPTFAFLARTTSRPTITAVWPSLLRVQATLVFYVELVALTS